MLDDIALAQGREAQADGAARRGNAFAPATLLLALLAGPCVALAVFMTGGGQHAALLLGVIGGWWALWTIRSLPVHFAPLLALLVLSLFSIEPSARLMSGFGMDAFWWMLGSWMLALAAWETGLIGVLFAARKGFPVFPCRLLAGLAGLHGTRAALWLGPFAQRDAGLAHFGFQLGRMVGLPSHALNLFAFALLPIASVERYSLPHWAGITLPLAAALALLSALTRAPGERDSGATNNAAALPLRMGQAQWLAGLALLLAWAGAASSAAHGLPSGVWFLYLGLMAVAARLLPLDRFWRGIDWPLLLTLGVGIGLAKTVAGALAPLLIRLLATVEGASHPLLLALALIGLSTLAFRCVGYLRSALIVLALALALASALAAEPLGWMLVVLTTLHWLDICASPAAANRFARGAVGLAGLLLIGCAAAAWHRLGVL